MAEVERDIVGVGGIGSLGDLLNRMQEGCDRVGKGCIRLGDIFRESPTMVPD